MRRMFGEATMSAGAVIVLLLTLVAVDDRVREHLSQRFSNPSMEFSSAGHQVQNLASVLARAARDQGIDNAPLLIFAFAAAVLTLFMLRT